MLGLKLNHVSKSGHWRPCEEAFRKGLQKRLNMPLECPPGNSTRYTSTCDTFLCQEIFILCMPMWLTLWNEANLRDLIAATGLVFLLKIGFKSLIFGPMWPGNLMEDLKKKTIGHLLYTMSSFVHHFKAIGEFKLELQSWNAQFGSKLVIICPLWPQNLTDDPEKQ